MEGAFSLSASVDTCGKLCTWLQAFGRFWPNGWSQLTRPQRSQPDVQKKKVSCVTNAETWPKLEAHYQILMFQRIGQSLKAVAGTWDSFGWAFLGSRLVSQISRFGAFPGSLGSLGSLGSRPPAEEQRAAAALAASAAKPSSTSCGTRPPRVRNRESQKM